MSVYGTYGAPLEARLRDELRGAVAHEDGPGDSRRCWLFILNGFFFAAPGLLLTGEAGLPGAMVTIGLICLTWWCSRVTGRQCRLRAELT